jgi:hypothetical protein
MAFTILRLTMRYARATLPGPVRVPALLRRTGLA